MNGIGVLMYIMSRAETAPSSVNVTRSPKHEATGGVILSDKSVKGVN